MKSEFTRTNPTFNPIEIKLTLESREDLSNFLAFTSQVVHMDFENQNYEGINVTSASVKEFADKIISSSDWEELLNLLENSR